MAHKRATPKDTKPIDTDGMGYQIREHEHGQSLPFAHPQRHPFPPIGPNGRTVTFTSTADSSISDARAMRLSLDDDGNPRVDYVTLTPEERRTDLSSLRAKGALLRRILLYAAFGALVGASVAILLHWLGA